LWKKTCKACFSRTQRRFAVSPDLANFAILGDILLSWVDFSTKNFAQGFSTKIAQNSPMDNYATALMTPCCWPFGVLSHYACEIKLGKISS
jgi:hypothetical protein